MEFKLEVVATEFNYDEHAYLVSNPDVENAVLAGAFNSGRHHFETFGKNENRKIQNRTKEFIDAKISKLKAIKPLLRTDMRMIELDQSFDFLSDELRQQFNIIDTANVSSNNYDNTVLSLISEIPSGLILDCGAGKRSTYYSNVVNFEIADYTSTDVRGVGEVLPFVDNSFDAVISIAVLEHVKDPFLCAKEIARVLKPGGKLVCSVPFLQPLHGYPNHYYNMSGQGLNNLFSEYMTIETTEVAQSMLPIWCLTWFLSSWADGLSPETRASFSEMKISDFIGEASTHLSKKYVTELSYEKNLELACATIITAVNKPN